MVELSKNHICWKQSLVTFILDYGQIPVKISFVTIKRKHIQKIRYLWLGKAQWTIKKCHKYKNIGAKIYGQSFSSKEENILMVI